MLVQTLAKTAKVEEARLVQISETASRRYKVYEIPKRTGGTRTIEHPSREVKAIQRWIVSAVFNRFPVHECATAYRKGCGIRENAERHQHSRYTDRFDFANFFPSFTQERVESFVRVGTDELGIELTSDDVRFVGNIVCRNRRLTIGAPSSPAITNTMMFEFDRGMYQYCSARELVYTRYADDIFVSAYGPNMLYGIEDQIRQVKREITHIFLRINRRKTVHLSKKRVRRITGVVITPEHKLSIGRERKREIKSLIHRWLNNNLDAEKLDYMRGLVAFARDIEPSFEERLRTKYGERALDEILRYPPLPIES
jgi:retron-type reverse transcriptase